MSSKTARSFNIPVINNLRGIAASMVCFYHFGCMPIDFIHTRWIFETFHLGELGVQMFFVISGIVIPLAMIKSEYTISNWGRFMWKRFLRLEPPYIVAIIVALIYFQVRRFMPGSAAEDMMLSGKELVLHIGYLIPFVEGARWAVPSLWTLSIEFQYYLILSLAFPLALRNINWRMFFYVFMLALPFIFPSGAFFPSHASLFMIGIAYALWFTGKIIKEELLIVISLSAAVAFITLPIAHAVVGLITLAVVHLFKDYQNKYLGFLGAISYSLYLTHQSTGMPVVNFLSHYVKSSLAKGGIIFLAFTISVGCAYIMYRLVEVPSLRWSKRIRYLQTR